MTHPSFHGATFNEAKLTTIKEIESISNKICTTMPSSRIPGMDSWESRSTIWTCGASLHVNWTNTKDTRMSYENYVPQTWAVNKQNDLAWPDTETSGQGPLVGVGAKWRPGVGVGPRVGESGISAPGSRPRLGESGNGDRDWGWVIGMERGQRSGDWDRWIRESGRVGKWGNRSQGSSQAGVWGRPGWSELVRDDGQGQTGCKIVDCA